MPWSGGCKSTATSAFPIAHGKPDRVAKHVSDRIIGSDQPQHGST